VPVLRILIDLLRHLRRWVMRLSPGCSGRGSSFPSRAAEEYGAGDSQNVTDGSSAP
jgi:hypothetical protein